MAKGGTKTSYTSKGIHRAQSNGNKAPRVAVHGTGDYWTVRKAAWEKGQNPWLTIGNPNKEETSKRFIRVRANDHWGNPKYQNIYRMHGA